MIFHIIPLLILLIQYTICQEIEPASSCLLNEVKADRSGTIRFDPSPGQATCALTLTQLTPGDSLYFYGELAAFPATQSVCPDGRPAAVTFSTTEKFCNSRRFTVFSITPLSNELSIDIRGSKSQGFYYFHGEHFLITYVKNILFSSQSSRWYHAFQVRTLGAWETASIQSTLFFKVKIASLSHVLAHREITVP